MDISYVKTAACARNDAVDEVAIVRPHGPETIHWLQLDQTARELERALVAVGLRSGHTVAFEPQPGFALYPLALACGRLGLELTAFDPARTRHPKLLVTAAQSTRDQYPSATVDELRHRVEPAPSLPDPAVATPPPDISWSIRAPRTPLQLVATTPTAAIIGEIIIHVSPAATPDQQPAVFHTGDVGWLDDAGVLVVQGRLAEIAIRAGCAILLPEIDAALRGHPGICASTSFLEHGKKPTEPVISVVHTDLEADQLQAWLSHRVAKPWQPDRIVTIPGELRHTPSLRPAALRSIVNGQAATAVMEVLTARRFRRSPPFKEPELHDLVQRVLMSQQPLEFLLFWGCGPRATADAPEHAAIHALQDLLSSLERVAPIKARADMIFTDGHATNNGHAVSHFQSYFEAVRQAAAGTNIAFHLESEVWQRGGLTKAHIQALEMTPQFSTQWAAFPLHDRFVLQASRHSRNDDAVAAARHYYATCLLERDLLKSLFGRAVFLTYNGPEFNECFPDLPTLYVYPGPRGRTDKPWFIPAENDPATMAVAAE